MSERTKHIYEHIEGYVKPPFMPLPDPLGNDSLGDSGIKPTNTSKKILKFAYRLSGFDQFKNQSLDTFEEALRTTNSRKAGLFALINSATLALIDDNRKLTPVERAATIILAAINLEKDIISAEFKQDQYKDEFLEMGQYRNLFSTCLTFENKSAKLYKSSERNIITVVLNGHYYLLNLSSLDPINKIGQIETALNDIINYDSTHYNEKDLVSVGVITAISHRAQTKIFSDLLKEEINNESMNSIKNSLFTLCLDIDKYPANYAEAAKIAHSENPSNRWYHSSLQIVVFGNSKACTICNFNTYVDGNTMMRSSAELQSRAAQISLEKNNSVANNLLQTSELKWKNANKYTKIIEQNFKWVKDEQEATFEIDALNNDLYSALNLNRVAVFVIALQATMLELFGKSVNIKQFLTLSKYRCMDLTYAVVSTNEVNNFAELLFHNGRNRIQESIELLRSAVRSEEKEAKRQRKFMPFNKLVSLFIESKHGINKFYTIVIIGITILILKLLGYYKREQVEVIISHPKIFKEIAVVGRPGIKLPYVKYFGLHYQIFSDKIMMTFMPGPGIKYSNMEIVKSLKNNLKKLDDILVYSKNNYNQTQFS